MYKQEVLLNTLPGVWLDLSYTIHENQTYELVDEVKKLSLHQ